MRLKAPVVCCIDLLSDFIEISHFWGQKIKWSFLRSKRNQNEISLFYLFHFIDLLIYTKNQQKLFKNLLTADFQLSTIFILLSFNASTVGLFL